MNAQQLKNAILQEAIEGRLLPQDPNDEPASALLARIRKEKEQLVKAGKLKKKDLEVKPISEDEIPFEIPDSWEWVRIKSIFSMQAGKNVTASDIKEEKSEKYPYICYGGNGIRGYVAKYNTTGCFPLVGRQGALCGNVNIAEGNFWATEHAVVTNGFGLTEIMWQYYFLTALNLNNLATATAQPGLAVSNVKESLIPLPPLAEQKRIVAKIEELLPKVEEYGKAQEALDKLNAELPDRLKKSVLQEAIEGRLVPQDPTDEPASVLLAKIRQEKEQLVKAGKLKKKDLAVNPISEDEIPFDIPDSWEWVRFSELYWQLTDGTHSTPKYTTSGIPFLSVKDMSSGKLSFINTKFISPEEHSFLSQRCHPQKGDLLLSKVGTTGIPLIIDTDKEFSIFVSLALIKFFQDFIDSKFLLFLINSPLVQFQAADNTRGVGNKNWVLKAISDTIMVLPPLAEQKRIVAKLEQVLGEIDKLKK